MFSFLKKKKDLPEFDFIKSYYDKEKYFVRIKKWNWLNPGTNRFMGKRY